MKINSAKAQGFTLIELVVVITILGILAAFAIPRSAALQTEARMAKMNAALGSIKAGASLAHALQISQNLLPGTQVTMEGSDIAMVNGYPSAALNAIGHAAGFNESTGVAIPGYITETNGNVFTVTPDVEHDDCTVTYTQAALTGAAPTYSNAGVIAANCQ